MVPVVVVLILFIAVLIGLLFKRQARQHLPDESQPILMMQQQVESLRTDLRSSLQSITDSVNQQLALVTQQIQSQTSNVGSRLDNAARVIGDVQKNLGELGKATEEIKELGQSVSKIEELLSGGHDPLFFHLFARFPFELRKTQKSSHAK
jgi:multidrug efflux pump subunit AcrB